MNDSIKSGTFAASGSPTVSGPSAVASGHHPQVFETLEDDPFFMVEPMQTMGTGHGWIVPAGTAPSGSKKSRHREDFNHLLNAAAKKRPRGGQT